MHEMKSTTLYWRKHADYSKLYYININKHKVQNILLLRFFFFFLKTEIKMMSIRDM